MTVRAVRLVAGVQLTVAAVPYYAAPTGTTSVVKRGIFSNVTAAPVTITVNVVPSGGSAALTNQVINARTLAPFETYVSPELAGVVLDPGDAIVALASVATSVVFLASGIQIT